MEPAAGKTKQPRRRSRAGGARSGAPKPPLATKSDGKKRDASQDSAMAGTTGSGGDATTKSKRGVVDLGDASVLIPETAEGKDALLHDLGGRLRAAEAREDALLREGEAIKKLHRCERRHYEETVRSLRRQRDAAEKEAESAGGVRASLQAVVSDLQSQLVEKDRQISALKSEAEKKTERSCALQADAEELRWKLANERNRAETFRRSFEESAVGAKESKERDEAELRRLRSAVEEKDARLAERDGEIGTMQESLRTSVGQNAALIEEVVRLKDDLSNLQNSGSRHGEERERELEEQRETARGLREELDEKREEKERLQKDFEDICESMKILAKSRRFEVDELQAKMSQLAADAQVREKEMGLLKLSLKEAELKQRHGEGTEESGCEPHKDDGDDPRTNDAPAVEAAIPGGGYEQRLENLRTENETLRSMFASLWDEATDLRGKVVRLSNEGENSPQTVQELKQRNRSLERYVAKLEKAIRRVLV